MPEPFPRLEGIPVVNLLSKAVALRCPLEAMVGENPPPLCTRISDLDAGKNRLEIHTFDDAEANRAMESGKSVAISLNLEGQSYRFRTVCAKGTPGVHSHRLELPTFIEIIQRRAYFRAEPPKPGIVSLRVRYNPDDQFTQAKLINLSLGGLLVEDKEILSCPEENQAVQIILQIEGGAKLTLSGKIRHVAPASPPDKDLRLGVQFDPLEPRDEASLSQLIMSWQREKRRVQLDV